jgi:intracellular multiplication protein IcmG
VSVSAVPPTESPKIMGRLEELTAKTQTNQTQISDLSSRLDSINKAIITLNKSVETMEKKLSAPVLVAQPPRNQMATAMPGERTHRGHHRWGHHGRTVNVQPQQMMPMPMMGNVSSASYVIRAILPGRAWIEGAGGGAFSVMEGDRVPGSGTVSKIDPENGEVTMDTGDVIKYGSDDH